MDWLSGSVLRTRVEQQDFRWTTATGRAQQQWPLRWTWTAHPQPDALFVVQRCRATAVIRGASPGGSGV